LDASENFILLIETICRDNDLDWTPNGFRRGKAKHDFSPMIPRRYNALDRLADDGIVTGVDYGPVLRGHFLREFVRGRRGR
jgi:hypothetical protein